MQQRLLIICVSPVSCPVCCFLYYYSSHSLTSPVRTETDIMLIVLLLLCSLGTPTLSVSSVIRLGHYYYYDVSTLLFDRKLQVEL